MFLAFGLIFIVLGGACAFAPEVIYELRENWKHGGSTTPSETYILVIRISGILYVIVGIASVICQFIL